MRKEKRRRKKKERRREEGGRRKRKRQKKKSNRKAKILTNSKIIDMEEVRITVRVRKGIKIDIKWKKSLGNKKNKIQDSNLHSKNSKTIFCN